MLAQRLARRVREILGKAGRYVPLGSAPASTGQGPAGWRFNPFSPAVHADPYPAYRRLRKEDPVHWNELMGAWLVTQYDDVVSVLRDPRFSADRGRAQNRFAERAEMLNREAGPLGRTTTMVSADPPDHTRLRSLASKAFTPRVVARLRPRIREVVDDLLDGARPSGRLDVVLDLAHPLTLIVIAEMLGVPPEDRDRFKRWSSDIVAAMGGPLEPADVLEHSRRSEEELADYFRGVIQARRREPRNDLPSAFVEAEEHGDVLSEDEIVATCMLLLIAGNETTINLLGNGMLALLRHPDQMQRLREDPSLVEPAVEELLRYDSPVQGVGRVAVQDVEIGGRRIRQNELVLSMLGAANRDPAQFSSPDELDIRRPDNRHVAFGFGIHACLGAPLARAEAQIAFDKLLRRIPRPRLDTGEVEWIDSLILRGPKRLPIAC